MKRFVYIVFLLLAVTAQAVTQQGYVKTVARAQHPGQPVGGVLIRVQGSHNTVESTDNGEFSLLLDRLQNGDAYSIARITKSGYEPAEQELIGRQLPCSERVPLEILLVNSAELLQEREAIAEKARQNVEQFYEQRLQLMDEALAAQRLTIQQYEQMRAQLESQYERFEPLIQTMSDLLARTDYGRLDSLTRLVQRAIENGNPDEAERLVREKGRFLQREREIREAEQQLDRAQATVDEAVARINAQRQEVQAQKRDLAEDYYRLYASFLQRFQNDSAGHYIRRRAALDTLNFDYQAQAGQFVKEILADYKLARIYFDRAYRIAQTQYIEQSGQMATITHELGYLCKVEGNLDKAMDWYSRSLAIRESVTGKNSPAVAEVLNNLGELYRAKKDLKQAMVCHQRALKIRQKHFDAESIEVAESKNNIAGLLYQQGKIDKAGQLYYEVNIAYSSNRGVPRQRIADNCTNLGVVYFKQGRYQIAYEYFEQAVGIYRQVLGISHPLTRNAMQLLAACKQKID